MLGFNGLSGGGGVGVQGSGVVTVPLGLGFWLQGRGVSWAHTRSKLRF